MSILFVTAYGLNATIDKTWDAEALVGQVLVKPYIDEKRQLHLAHTGESHKPVLSVCRPSPVLCPCGCSSCPVILEHIVDSHLTDLQLMYDKLLEFVPHHCRLLQEVTGGAISR
ncbi:unnamed protein product [Rangifer tarandus platyrhynchus]|uniref:Uncharacterized protein n=1 Tax=Rangifer tarandus platyrhynchus TaxID=3082113 RepID=A0ABN8Y9R7_RANTA|nr:unnamed protein product [Rangifer tarandus platyrhynchus]